MSDVACHMSCAKSCRDDTPISCDECAVGWWQAADGTGCQGKLAGSLYCTDKQMRWHTHTHTHQFNGPFSGTTWLSRCQKGKTNLDFMEARDSEWPWHQLGYMQVCTLLQTDNHTSTSPLSYLQARCPSCSPADSVRALKAV